MTLPLETGQIKDEWTRRAIERLALLFPLHAQDLANDVLLLTVPGTARKVAFAAGTWTWPGGTASSNDIAVNHGLGTTPVVVLVDGATQHGAGEVVDGNAFLYTATQFTCRGVFVKGFAPGAGSTAAFVWIAIG